MLSCFEKRFPSDGWGGLRFSLGASNGVIRGRARCQRGNQRICFRNFPFLGDGVVNFHFANEGSWDGIIGVKNTKKGGMNEGRENAKCDRADGFHSHKGKYLCISPFWGSLECGMFAVMSWCHFFIQSWYFWGSVWFGSDLSKVLFGSCLSGVAFGWVLVFPGFLGYSLKLELKCPFSTLFWIQNH